MRNAGLKFICRDVDLVVDATDTVFTRSYLDGQIIRIPIAHNEGNYFADEDTLNRLDGENRIAPGTARRRARSMHRPTRTVRPSISPILNEKRNVLGMMPHPERLPMTPWAAQTAGRCSTAWSKRWRHERYHAGDSGRTRADL